MNKCQLPELNECCCQCVYRIQIHSHPWYDSKSISNQIGWGCLWAYIYGDEGKWEYPRVEIQDTLEDGPCGICELFQSKGKYRLTVVENDGTK
jgi:hypothetical protein